MAYNELKEPWVNRSLIFPSCLGQNDAADKNDDSVFMLLCLFFLNVQATPATEIGHGVVEKQWSKSLTPKTGLWYSIWSSTALIEQLQVPVQKIYK